MLVVEEAIGPSTDNAGERSHSRSQEEKMRSTNICKYRLSRPARSNVGFVLNLFHGEVMIIDDASTPCCAMICYRENSTMKCSVRVLT